MTRTGFTASTAPPIVAAGLRIAALLAVAALGGACAREAAVEAERPVTHEQFSSRLVETGLGKTAMGERWLDSARLALESPLEIVPPYAESGGFLAHRAPALGLVFEGFEGQTLNLEVERRDDAGGQVFVELFRLRERDGSRRLLRALAPDMTSLRMTLPGDGRYLLRLQPELLVDALYDLSIELDAAIAFPIPDGTDGVGSFFGDPREAGSRQHEGIDIFVPRHTPVVAVAAGRAVTRTTPRGGNVVWLRARGASYYYAHLEQAAFAGAREVEAGEVLGYVGNSGNAKTTPPHLHFGVYRRGHGAVDPLPRLAARLFDNTTPLGQFEPRYVRTRPERLNLRAGPGETSEILDQLEAGTVVRAEAIRGQWLRVHAPGPGRGWIHSAFQDDVAPLASMRPKAAAWLLDSAAAGARPVGVVRAAEELDVLGRHGEHLLVRTQDGVQGWISGARTGDEDAPGTVLASGSEDSAAGEEPSAAPGAGAGS
jgi:peptidoglycan LD-endopeptidase LytH